MRLLPKLKTLMCLLVKRKPWLTNKFPDFSEKHMATENKNLSEYDKATIPSAKNFRFGIVVSEWYDTITEGLYKGAYSALIDNDVLLDNIIRWNRSEERRVGKE